MSENPVWRESMEIYFAEGHGFAVYFYLLIILAPVEFLVFVHTVVGRADVERLGEPVQSDGGDDFGADGLFFAARGQSRVRAMAFQIAQDVGCATKVCPRR